MEQRQALVESSRDNNAENQRHARDGEELSELLAHMTTRSERPVTIPPIIIDTAGNEPDGKRKFQVEPEMQEDMKDHKADDCAGCADEPELDELFHAAAHGEFRLPLHASQYQSANSTVNRPRSGSESATIAELTTGLRPHSASNMNAGKITSTKRGMLI